MGLKEKFAALKGKAAGQVAQFKNWEEVDASLAVIALVAGADGAVEEEEVAMAVDYVGDSDLFKGFDRQKLSDRLDGYFIKAVKPLVKKDLFDIIAKMKSKPNARDIVSTGYEIAYADGEFEDKEKAVLQKVCLSLGLQASSFTGLA